MGKDMIVTENGVAVFLAILAQAIREIERMRTIQGTPVKVFRDQLRYLVSLADQSPSPAGRDLSRKDLSTLRELHAMLEGILKLGVEYLEIDPKDPIH